MEDCWSNWFFKSSADISVEQSLTHCADSVQLLPHRGPSPLSPRCSEPWSWSSWSCTNETPGFSGFRLGLTREAPMADWRAAGRKESQSIQPPCLDSRVPDKAWCLSTASFFSLSTLTLDSLSWLGVPYFCSLSFWHYNLFQLDWVEFCCLLQSWLHYRHSILVTEGPPSTSQECFHHLHPGTPPRSLPDEYGHACRPAGSECLSLWMSMPSPMTRCKGLDVLKTNNKT